MSEDGTLNFRDGRGLFFKYSIKNEQPYYEIKKGEVEAKDTEAAINDHKKICVLIAAGIYSLEEANGINTDTLLDKAIRGILNKNPQKKK